MREVDPCLLEYQSDYREGQNVLEMQVKKIILAVGIGDFLVVGN